MNPTDGFSASSGSGFIDLSGFGAKPPNCQLQKTISTVAGSEYAFSFDKQATLANVTVNSIALSLFAGSTNGTWTTHTAIFTTTSSSSLLSLNNAGTQSTVVFVDNLSLTQAGSTTLTTDVAEPTLLT